jgi:(p)ppGpp synthase/HD superfamily hydrolase
MVEKTLQREGKTAVNLEALANKLGFAKVDDLFLSVGKDEFSLRRSSRRCTTRAKRPSRKMPSY